MRYAVVFKCYAWDGFVHRQAARCQKAAGEGDFFVSIDETSGSVGPIPFDAVVRTCNADMIGMGFANRFEQGSLLWWNPDYVHYQFQARHPDYDYYVFVEYDAVVQMDIGHMMEHMAGQQADLVSLPTCASIQDWHWTLYHCQTYPIDSLKGSLICISAFSRRALEMLADRRRQMSSASVAYWPMAEVFVPTEIAMAGYRSMSLAAFGAVDNYRWSSPMLECDLANAGDHAFLHPVLDHSRYVPAVLRSANRTRSFLWPRSAMWRTLSKSPPEEYMPMLCQAAYKRLRTRMREKMERRKLRKALAHVIAGRVTPADIETLRGNG